MIALDGTRALSAARVGGKAAGINAMAAAGFPVPPAFALPCASGLDDRAAHALRDGVAWLEARLGRRFGGREQPLLVAVRSGAAQSMPGMMDTILNLGMTAAAEEALARETGDGAFAADVRRRFAAQFAGTVGHPPPGDPWDQLHDAAAAVFASWQSERCRAYRRHHGIDGLAGTAVTVQAMVFGNLDDRSGTGVLFTRDPLTGARHPLGEWLPRGQGEDIVSGRHTPLPLSALAASLPDVHGQLLEAAARLERQARDVQDIEFTVQSGRLWLLQTRVAKRSPVAAVRLAVQLARDGLIDPRTALGRVGRAELDAMLCPHIDPAAAARASVLLRGEPASPGAGSGVVVGDADTAEDAERDVVLARPTTDPDDVHGMIAARALVTELGGATSHAAVVSRELGKPCVVGCGAGATAALHGTVVTVDGGAGVVYAGALPLTAADPSADEDLACLAEWARRHPQEGAAVARARAGAVA